MFHCVVEQFKKNSLGVVNSPSKTVGDTDITKCTRNGARISFVVSNLAKFIRGLLSLLPIPAHRMIDHLNFEIRRLLDGGIPQKWSHHSVEFLHNANLILI